MAGKPSPRKKRANNPTPPPPQWSKGQSGNPAGRPKGLSLPKEIKKLTADQFQEIIETALNHDETKLKQMRDRKETTALQYGVINCILKAMFVGDWDTFTSIVERVTGSQPKKIDITSNGKTIVQDSRDLSKLSTDELRLYKELEEKTKKEEGNVSTSIH